MEDIEQVVKITLCYSCNVQPKGKKCPLFDKCSQYSIVQSTIAFIEDKKKPMLNLLNQAIDELFYFNEGCEPSSKTRELLVEITELIKNESLKVSKR